MYIFPILFTCDILSQSPIPGSFLCIEELIINKVGKVAYKGKSIQGKNNQISTALQRVQSLREVKESILTWSATFIFPNYLCVLTTLPPQNQSLKWAYNLGMRQLRVCLLFMFLVLPPVSSYRNFFPTKLSMCILKVC